MSFGLCIRLPARACFQPSARRTLSTTTNRLADTQRSDASQVISKVSKQEGGTFKGSKSAQMQSELTKQRNQETSTGNQRGPTSQTNTTLDPAEQSQLDRKANYVEQADKVATKMETEPENVTKEDGDTMHSRETKAFGNTEKGGIASQAQSLAAENAGAKKN